MSSVQPLTVRERIAQEIMPAAFQDRGPSWRNDARRRALDLADRILAIARDDVSNSAGA